MNGFDIYINNKKISVAIRKGASILYANANRLTISGINEETQEHLKWIEQMICVGDKIKVIVTEVEKCDKPISRELVERKILLKRYMCLKKALTDKGLLK